MTMSSGLSFHIAPRALDLEREFSPRILFADSVRHVIDGHVGAEPYYRISTKSVARRLKASALEQRMRELFALDFNPLICMTRQLNSELALFRAWNTYQQHVSLSVRTIIHGHSNEQFTIARRQVSYDIDPPAAREAALCAIDILKGAAMRKREQRDAVGDVRARPSLSAMAATLGLQRSVAFEVTLCLEEMPGLNVAGVCRVLGCKRRTLERHCKGIGLTPVELKMACALIGATNSLWGGYSLTEIAAEHGFSDQAHMTRAFRRACGLPPSVLRSLAGHVSVEG